MKLPELVLSDDETGTLEQWARRPTTAQAVALRSRIVLRCAQGDGRSSNTVVADELGVQRGTVAKWRSRFVAGRLDGLLDEPRPGRPRTIGDDQVEAVIVKTLEWAPRDATHWSTRSMAAEVGMTQSAVSRIWRAFGLQPHRQDSWKLSKDPQFVDKVKDVVGLYLNPPERAVVLCVDEKSQIQALDRTAPILPMLPGTPERVTHDYTRHGTSSLYAALDITTGKVIGSLHTRHRAIEFKKFLATIDKEVPGHLAVHLVLDNASTHRPRPSRNGCWLTRVSSCTSPRPRARGSTWSNAGSASSPPRSSTRRASVRPLNTDIRAWIGTWNDNHRPYVWTKTTDQILDSIARYCTRINDSGH